MVTVVVGLVLVHVLSRRQARRIEAGPGSRTDKVHRIRTGSMVAVLGMVLLVAPFFLELHVEVPPLRDLPTVLRTALWFLFLVAAIVVRQRAVWPVYARLRGIDADPRRSTRRTGRALAVLLAPQLVWFAVLGVLVARDASGFVVAGAVLAYVAFTATLGPLLVRGATPSRAPTDQERARLQQICTEHGVRIRGIRVLDTSHDPAVNAAFSGFGPGPKYIFVTDRLLDTFDEEELAAVMAHEIAHRKKHHIAAKLGAQLGTVVVLAGLLGLVAATTSGVPQLVLGAACLLLLVCCPLLVQGTLGIRLEQQADDYAVEHTDAGVVRRMLEDLADQNMVRRHTGRLWNMLTQHPGMQQRIDRLESEGASGRKTTHAS